ncbi:MAG TPA: hypothetical protein VGW38_29000 [Chloroflexota bacterium]|nr:hypothetical protein [Chloroflexota bacterium]
MASIREPVDKRSWQHDRRQSLTLDLFTRYDPFWHDVARLRDQWSVTASTELPPSPPPGDLTALGILSWLRMPERVHLPSIPPHEGLDELQRLTDKYKLPASFKTNCEILHMRARIAEWLRDLRTLFQGHVPEARQSGDNAQEWMSWAPFLSACIVYDPPDTALIEYAAHDDHDATALPKQTYWQDPEAVKEAERWLSNKLRLLDRLPDSRERELAAVIVRSDYVQKLAGTWRESDGAIQPRRRVGKPSLEPLVAVQCAVYKDRYGLTYRQINDRMSWELSLDLYDHRRRANRAINHVKQGRLILEGRKYSSE